MQPTFGRSPKVRISEWKAKIYLAFSGLDAARSTVIWGKTRREVFMKSTATSVRDKRILQIDGNRDTFSLLGDYQSLIKGEKECAHDYRWQKTEILIPNWGMHTFITHRKSAPGLSAHWPCARSSQWRRMWHRPHGRVEPSCYSQMLSRGFPWRSLHFSHSL